MFLFPPPARMIASANAVAQVANALEPGAEISLRKNAKGTK